MNVVKVLRHGQITLPKTLREELDIREGDILEIELERSRLVLKTKMLVDRDEAAGAAADGTGGAKATALPEGRAGEAAA